MVTSPPLAPFLEENLFSFKNENCSFWMNWVLGIHFLKNKKQMQMLLSRTYWCIFKSNMPFTSQEKGKKTPLSSNGHHYLQQPLPQPLQHCEASPLAHFLIYCGLMGIFLSFTSQRNRTDPESGNPAGWSSVLFLLWTCCITMGKPPSTSHHASVSPSPLAGDCSHPKDAQSLSAAYYPVGPPSAHPAAQGCQEGRCMGAGGGLAALKWRWNTAIILPASPPPSCRMAKLPYELK